MLIGAGLIGGVWLGLFAIPILVGLALVAGVVGGRFHYGSCVVLIVAAGLGAFRGSAEDGAVLPDGLAASTGAVGTVASLPSPSRSGDRVLLRVECVTYSSNELLEADFLAIVWLPEHVVVAPGDRLEVMWSVQDLGMLPPGFGSYVRSQGASATGYAREVTAVADGGSWQKRLVHVRRTLADRFESALPGDTGALASGIVTGDDSALGDAAREAFLRTGTSHITAVSGSNVAMLLALWNLIVRPGRFRRMAPVQGAIIATIWLYAVLVGLEPPAVRAALVASLALLAMRSGRHPDPMTLLFLASATLVFWNPRATGMVSFWLSFVASAALVARLPSEPQAGWAGGVKALGSGVVFAYLGTLPVVLAVFGTWSVSAIFANALLMPLMAVAFPLTFALGLMFLVVPDVATVVAWVPGLILDLALEIVHELSVFAAPLQFRTVGWVGTVSIGMLCAVLVLAYSQDGRRWARLVTRDRRGSAITLGILLLASAIGSAVGVAAALVR